MSEEIKPFTTFCYIEPGCVEIGKNVMVKPFTVIGMTGFGFERENDKYKIPLKRKEHKYKVIIGDNVEIGAGCVLDRGSWRDSVIGEGTKIDNLVHTGHNTVIGKNNLITTGVKLGGSTTIGDNCFLGMLCTTKQGIKIGNNCTIQMGANVAEDMPDNSIAKTVKAGIKTRIERIDW